MSLLEIEPGTGAHVATRPVKECLHCGLELSSSQRETGVRFCCTGCERVHGLLHDAGLDRFYTLRGRDGVPPLERRSRDFAWLDAMLETEPDADLSRPRRLRLDIQGIHCAACVWLLEQTFRRFAGGIDLRINPALGQADLVWVPERGDLRDWLAEAESFGYRFGPERKTPSRASRSLLGRLGLSAGAAAQVMMFSLCFYLGVSPENGLIYPVLGWLSLAFTTAVLLLGGSLFLVSAWRGLRRGLVHLDLPIAVGITLAYTGSVIAFFRAGPEAAYFDSVAVFIVLMLAGRWLQERILERNRNALLADGGVDGLVTRRLRDDRLETIPAVGVRPGDRLVVVAGDLVPVAAVLTEHPGRVALDWITGEAGTRAVEPGESVPAGAFNGGSEPMLLTAQEGFADSRLQDLLRPGAGDEGRDPGAVWWERLSRIYVFAVFAAALAGFGIWIGHGWERALEVTVAVLVVTCPCALGLAVPLARELTHVALRRRGVFVRRARFLDRALRVSRVVFDKTGTLTLGNAVPDESSREAMASLADGDREALRAMTALSNHPASRALARAAGAPQGDPLPASVTEEPGRGLTRTTDHAVWRLGRADFAVSHGFGDGVVFSRDGREIARFRLVEEIKTDAVEEVRALREAGLDVHVLSGDRPDRVARVALGLGLPANRVHGGLSPEEKADWITAVDREDTLMVGDGLNDGPGLDRAFCAATPAVDHPAVPARADFYFLGDRVGGVRAALGAARRLRRAVRGILAFAIGYNAIALALCYVGLVTPLVAAVLMPLGSAAVVTGTALRLRDGRNPWTL